MFANFFADMGARPPGMTLERVDNNKGYSPRNCAWVPQEIQKRNTTRNRYYAGRTMSEWARELGVNRSTVKVRMNRHGNPFGADHAPRRI